MTWRDKTLVAVLLLVAKIIAPEHAHEVSKLATHISVHGGEAE